MNSIRSCHGCKERRPGCHSTCEKYKQEKAKYEKDKESYKKSLSPIIRHGAFLGDDGLAKYRPSNYRHK